MGLIKTAIAAVGGTLGDQWKEAIHCPVMDNKVLLRNGQRMNADSSRNGNQKGTDNVISNGSIIMVEENTCMLTVDNGRITNVVTEPGAYKLDNSSAPSIFAGQITDALKDVISRFTFGGTPATQQKVVYINLQELPGIRFGTSTPVPYPDPRYNTTIDIRFFGTFAIKIIDVENAVKFYHEVASKGISAGDMTVSSLFEQNDQYKSEFMMAMNRALNTLAGQGVCYNQIASQLDLLIPSVVEETAVKWASRGFTVTNVGMNPATLSSESRELLAERLKADTMLDPNAQRAMMATSIARGIEAAGSNEGGAMMGFAGINMGMQAGGNILGQMPQATMPVQQAPVQPAPVQQAAPSANSWKCSCGTASTTMYCPNCGSKKPDNTWKCSCGQTNTGKFCIGCGSPKGADTPAAKGSWKCVCGTENTSKFCMNCGEPKPVAEKKFKCDKCGWTPEDPTKPPKFCPECGDIFNDDDLV